jgi:hypothetical protein
MSGLIKVLQARRPEALRAASPPGVHLDGQIQVLSIHYLGFQNNNSRMRAARVTMSQQGSPESSNQ